MSEAVLVIPRRNAIAAGVAALVLVGGTLAGLQPPVRTAVAAAVDPRTVAASATIDQQRERAENSIQRGYAASIGKLDQVRKLTLAISPSSATAIDDKARASLRGLRHDALVALVRSSSSATDAAVLDEVGRVEARLDQASFGDEPGVLLAPSLYTIVARADELFATTTDAAIRELTTSPSPTPSPSRTPSATPTPSGR